MGAKYPAVALLAAQMVLILAPMAGFAQSNENNNQANLRRQDNITSTGATVPLPGTSKSAGQTSLDREIERHNDRIDKSICSNC